LPRIAKAIARSVPIKKIMTALKIKHRYLNFKGRASSYSMIENIIFKVNEQDRFLRLHSTSGGSNV
jgi:hypothetical protein